jgi:hypothetical protein
LAFLLPLPVFFHSCQFCIYRRDGDLFLQSFLNFKDPYGPPGRTNLGYDGNMALISGAGFPGGSSSVAWPDYPDNRMKVEFAGKKLTEGKMAEGLAELA